MILRQSEMPGEFLEVPIALFKEGIASLLRLVRHVRESRRLSGEYLLTDESIIHEIHRELCHALCRRALTVDLLRPVERRRF